jgi:hypothetical protein
MATKSAVADPSEEKKARAEEEEKKDPREEDDPAEAENVEDSPDKEEEDDEPTEDEPEKEDEEDEPSEDDKPEEDDEDDEPEEEDEEDEPKKEPAPERMKSIAGMLGLHSRASLPAQKARVLALVALESAVLKTTGAKNATVAIGSLRALADDAAQVHSARKELKGMRKRAQYEERLSLLKRLSAANLPGYQRGELFTDKEVNGKLVSRPSAVYSEMKIATLRGLVDGKLSGRSPSPKRNPFEPDAEAAKLASDMSKTDPKSLKDRVSTNSTASKEQIDRTTAALAAQGVIR